MVFKHYRIQIIIRVLILGLVLTALVYSLLIEKYLRSVYVAIALIISIAEFIRFGEKNTRELTSFLNAIQQNDFTTSYPNRHAGKIHDQLHGVFNVITQKFRAITEDKEAQFRYLELLVEHVRVGILSFDEREQIHLINDSMKHFLGRPHAHSLKGLESNDAGFVEAIRQIKVGENRLIKIQTANKVIPLAIHASEFSLQGKYYKLISAQDIRNELEVNELEAWQKLIRVLTHEIMNSISPIVSLSATLHGMVVKEKESIDPHAKRNLEQGLEAIRSRSEALQHFTKAYRTLTRIPQPKYQEVQIHTLLEHLRTLFRDDLNARHVELRVGHVEDSLTILADPDLIQQVLINLFKNAMDAVEGTDHPVISLSARRMNHQVTISLADNGAGIAPDVLDKIFVPFFTTKQNGSGIGLAFSRQVVQLHGGQISIKSEQGTGTTVEIII